MNKMLIIMLYLLPASLLAMDIPEVSTVLPGYYEQSAKEKYLSNGGSGLEGLWYYPDENMTCAIERIENIKNSHKETYRIVVVESEDCSVDLGSIAGYIEKTAALDEMNVWLYSAFNGENLVNPIKCLATVDKSLKCILLDKPKVKLQVSVNLLRFLPSVFRGIRVYPHIDNPEAKAGFRKIEDKEPIFF